MMIQTREDFAKYFHELGFTVGAEIGVLRGEFSAVLCEANPDLKLYCVDAWGFGEHKRKAYHLQAYEEAKARLAPFNAILIHKFSMDAVKDFSDESLDFVYIDANHRDEFVAEDIREWAKKVKKGGIVSGHDYCDHFSKKVVDEYIKKNGVSLFVTPKRSDKSPSWWFVKK